MLPESDLLKAIYEYASDFYSRATDHQGLVDFESLDETALMSLGILLEEMAVQVLGDTGDLGFVEGEELGGAEHKTTAEDELESDGKVMEAAQDLASSEITEGSSGAQKKRKRKRRKTKRENNEVG